MLCLKNNPLVAGDDSLVKITGYSCRGPMFDSQLPHISTQASVTLVTVDPTFSSDLCGHQVHM